MPQADMGETSDGRWHWGREKDHIFKVELPNKSGTSYPRASHPRAEIKAWNICLGEPQMSSFHKVWVIKVSDVWRHAAGYFCVFTSWQEPRKCSTACSNVTVDKQERLKLSVISYSGYPPQNGVALCIIRFASHFTCSSTPHYHLLFMTDDCIWKNSSPFFSILSGSLVFIASICSCAYVWITSASQQQEVIGQFLIPLGPSGRRTLFIRHTWLLVASP